MKKMIPVLLAAMAAVSLSACATKTVTETATAAPAATEAPVETSAVRGEQDRYGKGSCHGLLCRISG